MKKRFFSILTAMALCLNLLPTVAWAEGLIGQFEDSGIVNLENSYNRGNNTTGGLIGANAASGSTLPKGMTEDTDGIYELTADVTLTETLRITGAVTLNLNGKTLTGSGNASDISVEGSGSLTLTGGGTIKNSAITGSGNVSIDCALSMIGGTVENTVTVESSGSITEKSSGVFSGKVSNYGTISGGTFTGEVTNDVSGSSNKKGSISGGTFNGEVTNCGTVSGGTFTGKVTNGKSRSSNEAGKILNGTFGEEVTNNADSEIKGGIFNREVTNKSGTISGGTFHGSVTNQSEGGNGDGGKIYGGTFYEKVTNQSVESWERENTIGSGTFNGPVINEAGGVIHGGTFNRTVENYGTIGQGGEFNGTVTNNGSIENGDYNGTVINNTTISGGNFNGEVSGNGTLPNERYVVKFTVDGKEYAEKFAIRVENSIGSPAAPTKPGYTFDGWYYEKADGTDKKWNFGDTVGINFQGVFTNRDDIPKSFGLAAKWNVKTYTVTFDQKGGSISDGTAADRTTVYNAAITKPTNPTKDSARFDGWFYGDRRWDFTKTLEENLAGTSFDGTGDTITLTARWAYPITYELNGGTNHSDNPAEYIGGVGASELFAPTRDGYTFGGWYLGADCNGDPITNVSPEREGNITLYAKWSAKEYSITYQLNGGTNHPSNPAQYVYGAGVDELFDPSRDGYTFGGWYPSAECNGDPITNISPEREGNITLYAKWSAKEYSITYQLNGGTNHPSNPAQYVYGAGVDELFDPTRDGYTFGGWYLSAECSGDPITNISPEREGNITLYAKWSAKEYSITYQLNGGTNHQSNPAQYVYGAGVDKLFAPTRDGYTFDGWYLTPDFSSDALTDISAETMGDITLYAKWTRYYNTITSGTLSRSDGSKLADENGAVSADKTIKDGRVTGFTVDGKSLDGIDLKDLNLRLTVEDTKLSLSPAAIRQLLDANADSLTLDMPGAEMTIPQEMLRGILKQLNGKDLEISLVSGETAMDGLSPEQKLWVPIMQERGEFLPLSALTGEFSVGGEPLDWSQVSGSLDISLTLEMPKIEKKTGWHNENGQWIYYEDNGEPMKPEDLLPLGGTNRLEFGYMVLDENNKWVRRGLEPPTILPLPNLRELTDYEDLEQDWDLPRSEDIVPEFKWIDDRMLLDFELPHFSTYLIVTRIAMPFNDVSEGAWYYDAVKWATDKNITGGTDNTHFSPDATCTRAQLVTFLWRLAGEPVVNYLMPFSDVDEGAWYAEAIRWAASEKIVEGTTNSTFEPNATVSRAQAVTMLWRYAKYSGTDVSVGEDTNILSYNDAFDVPAWAIEAVQWACGTQVLRGSGEKLMLDDPCTRAQIVTFLYRAYNK